MNVNSDFSDLLSALNDAGVRFLIIGAYAVIHYTEPRYTKDLDLWAEPTKANARRLISALRAFGAPVDTISEHDLSEPEIVYQIGVAPVRVDILTSVPGLKFRSAYRNALETTYGNIPVKVLALEDILQAKRAAGRPQDLLDAQKLELARERMSLAEGQGTRRLSPGRTRPQPAVGRTRQRRGRA